MTATSIPDRTEAAEYYFKYIDQVDRGDICRILEDQPLDALAQLRTISEDRSLHRYAPDKWSIREVLGHINDCERLFLFRAYWFARGFDSPLPSFDQDVAAAAAGADSRSWASHLAEFVTVRAATLSFFHSLEPADWDRRGVASGNPFTVRALAFIAAGHLTHHLRVLEERYS